MNPHQRLQQAWFFVQQGQYGKAIDIARPLIDSDQLSGIELGRACLMLGVAYGGDGKFAEARSAFERSLRILDHDLEHVTDYAAALDNYASLYNDAGQLDIAGQMWQKALSLRQQRGDHAGATRSFTNLAGLALAQKRIREAKRYLKRANTERKWTHELVADDSATLFEVEGWLATAEGNPSTAIAKYEQALEISKGSHGEQHWLTGWEYMLRGKAYAQSGNMDRALADMRRGLVILDHAVGNKNPKYCTAQIAYSQILDQTGSHAEAAQIKAAAEQASKAFYRGQCVGCTINVAAFR